MSTTRVLFLCTGNSARSQMAEAFLRQYAGDRFEAHSAGLEPQGINPYTIRVMDEIGISLAGQYAKPFSQYMGQLHFGYLITVCADAEEKCPSTYPGMGQRLHWNLADPAAFAGPDAARLAQFREIRDQIDQRIRDWLAEQGIERPE